MSRPTQIVIDLHAIKHNCALVSSIASQSNIVAMVKADAYGHGASEVALAIQDQVAKFGVCCLQEALSLRHAGISLPIVLIEGCFSPCEYIAAAELQCEVVIHNAEQLAQFLSLEISRKLTVWLKVDSGMHRLGFAAHEVPAVYAKLEQSRLVDNIILTSHFANADALSSPFTPRQMQDFEQVLATLNNEQQLQLQSSLANSAAIFAWPQSHKEWVRPGLMLYGLNPFEHNYSKVNELIPAMTFRSQVMALHPIAKGEMVGYGNIWIAQRPSLIATVAVGYGDGYPRSAKTGAPVMINGQRAPLAGRVSMDMLCVDVTDIAEVKIGDDVELWGKNLLASEVAQWAGTVAYELITRMPRRAKRVYPRDL